MLFSNEYFLTYIQFKLPTLNYSQLEYVPLLQYSKKVIYFCSIYILLYLINYLKFIDSIFRVKLSSLNKF